MNNPRPASRCSSLPRSPWVRSKLVPAARVTWDKSSKRLEIENYNTLPVELLSVTAKKP